MPTRVHHPESPRLPRELVDRWAGVPSSVAADLLAGRTVVDPAIRPLRPFAAGARLVGSVVTAWCEGTDYGAVHHAIAVAEAGDVIVVEAGARVHPAIIGDLLGGAARAKGVKGVAVNGPVRDAGTFMQWPDFAVFSRSVTPRGPTTKERGVVNAPMAFAGVLVSPRDLIIGDDDGLVVIPRSEAEDHVEAALKRVRDEQAWERELAGGRRTLDLFDVPPAG